MGLDPKITEAIEAATADSGQSPALARRLVAWLEAVTSGNEDVNNTAEADRHLEVLYEETAIPGATDDGGDS